MDSGHRLCKALLEGHQFTRAIQFAAMPELDEIHELDT